MTTATLVNKMFNWAGLQLWRVSPFHQGGKHGGVQADMVLEEPRVLRLDPQAAEGDCGPHWV